VLKLQEVMGGTQGVGREFKTTLCYFFLITAI
jgi:hypothetical protein